MKKFILTAAIAAFGLSTAVAQDAGLQGTWFAGGQVSFGNTNNKATDTKTNSYFILPIVGTFISPSVAVGAGIGYIGGDTKVNGTKTESNSTFAIKPLVRKYWNVSGGLFFFGQAALPVTFGNTKDYTAVGTTKSDTFGATLELSPGFDYVINSWMTIETSFTIFSMGYDTSKVKGGKSSNNFNLNANPFNSLADRNLGSLQVGVKFLF